MSTEFIKRGKPSGRLATGWTRDFTNETELSKRQQQNMLADAVRNTAAMKPQKPKESRRNDR